MRTLHCELVKISREDSQPGPLSLGMAMYVSSNELTPTLVAMFRMSAIEAFVDDKSSREYWFEVC